MKSIVTIIGTFFFGLFCELFIRVVIIFYHQSEFTFSGISSLPGFGWVFILGLGLFTATWIASMLAVTITNFAPFKHLIALFTLFLLWRISEYFGMDESSLIYTFGIIIIQFTAIALAYFIKVKTNVQTTPTAD